MEIIKRHPNKTYYEKLIPTRVILGDAVNANKFNDLGSKKPMYSSIDLFGISQDGEFEKLPRTGHQLLTRHFKSKPVKVFKRVT